ncbi:hypothetical protein fugu_000268 [Takifugu bimaculatus]|uniref:Uncharacterized protein n=1 Tax=Takifugu bimaculatus TaxID=433685 RepID=A0A4Z2CG88_9TELE|nr:hypothetical protein fugu_000268 [Takifugu bimaculatus]
MGADLLSLPRLVLNLTVKAALAGNVAHRDEARLLDSKPRPLFNTQLLCPMRILVRLIDVQADQWAEGFSLRHTWLICNLPRRPRRRRENVALVAPDRSRISGALGRSSPSFDRRSQE